MPNEKALSIVNSNEIEKTKSDILIESASQMATRLKSIIDKQELFVTIRDRKHVKVEGWTALAALNGCIASEEKPADEILDGVFLGHAVLTRQSDGAVLGRASAECGSPDEVDKDGAPIWAERARFQRRSMATTRAIGKVCRLAFSWIMVLAGYDATPAEEMSSEEKARRKESPSHSNKKRENAYSKKGPDQFWRFVGKTDNKNKIGVVPGELLTGEKLVELGFKEYMGNYYADYTFEKFTDLQKLGATER